MRIELVYLIVNYTFQVNSFHPDALTFAHKIMKVQSNSIALEWSDSCVCVNVRLDLGVRKNY